MELGFRTLGPYRLLRDFGFKVQLSSFRSANLGFVLQGPHGLKKSFGVYYCLDGGYYKGSFKGAL